MQFSFGQNKTLLKHRSSFKAGAVFIKARGIILKLLILAKSSLIKKIFLKDAVCEFALLGTMGVSSSLGEVPPWLSREQGSFVTFKAFLSAVVFAEVSVHLNSDVLGRQQKNRNHKRIFSA